MRITVTTACLATMLGTLAGLVMARFGRFRGRTLFSGLVSAPLVMPDVIIGLSLLLLFVSLDQWIGWPAGRGMDTITIAHVTFCMAYVAVIVQSRLSGLDESLEEATLDLGARPLTAFATVTLPMIAPALVAGWLLSFTLSLDDLVIASFVSGPASSTLPMVVFSKVRLGVSPKINALATLLILVATLTILLAAWAMHRQEKSREKAARLAAREEG
jgi:putrescine transport system permease protein